MPAVTSQAAAALSQEFPGWTLWVSGTGRWWASRRDALSAAEQAAGCVPFLHADARGHHGPASHPGSDPVCAERPTRAYASPCSRRNERNSVTASSGSCPRSSATASLVPAQ